MFARSNMSSRAIFRQVSAKSATACGKNRYNIGIRANFSDDAQLTASSGRKVWQPTAKATNRIKSSNQLKFEMELIFLKASIAQTEVDAFIYHNLSSFDQISISELMRLSVKSSKTTGTALLKNHLPKIAAKLKSLSTANWSHKQISFVIYGLQWMNQYDEGSLDVIAAMGKVAVICLKKQAPTEQEISMLLLGLQHMSDEKEETRKLLLVLASMINRCSDDFIPQTVGNVFYGLKGMKSDSVEVRTVLTALLPKVIECKGNLSAQHAGNSLYGLQEMHSDCPEVRAILKALVPKITASRQLFLAQEVSNALYGLQGMNSKLPEVCDVLKALEPKLRECNEEFCGQHIGNILYGLQAMSSEEPEVRGILSGLVQKIRESKDFFNEQTVGNALYGLQGMRSTSKEVCAILSALVPKVYSCRDHLEARDIANAVYGLQGLGNQLESSLLLDYLFKSLQALIADTSDFTSLKTGQLFHLCQTFTVALPEIRNSIGDKIIRWESVLALANKELETRRDNGDVFFTPGNARSPNERHVHSVAETLFRETKILMSFNGYLFGLFETDLVLKIPVAGSDEAFYINIEMKGVYHKRQKRERFCMLRDKYLESRGVFIERVDILLLRQMDEGDLMKWLLSRVDEATAKRAQIL